MATDNASPPPDTEPKCEKCGSTTALLSFIPRFGEQPAYHIFECSDCKALTWKAEAARE